MSIIGKPIDRVDGRLKVTGKARYSAEIPLHDVANAVIVTSTVATGRIARMDTSRAERAPGVIAVITHQNAPKIDGSRQGGQPAIPVLQDDLIRYDRQPIAVVVADTFERATDAASLVRVEYDGVRAPRTFEVRTPPPEMPGATNGSPDSSTGDADAAFGDAAVRVDHVYTTPIEHHNPMEPHATTAVWDGDRLTVYDSTQGIFRTRSRIAAALGIPAGNVHVITKFVGGGFGGKGSAWAHTVLCAAVAKAVGRPIRLALTRPQMFSSVGYRPPARQRVALGASRDGKLSAVIHEAVSQTSSFDVFQPSMVALSRMLYASPNIRTSQRIVRADAATPTFMRAPGQSVGSFALESAIDELAFALGIDPLDLRLRNYAEIDPEHGLPYSSKSLRECYRLAAERFGWSRRTPQPRSMRQGNTLVGMGMATATYPAHRSPAAATARIMSDGSALVQCGSQDIGTGAYTIFTQISADALGLPIERVRFDLGDTAMPMAPSAGGSTSTASAGSAIKLACDAAREKLVALAIADTASPLYRRNAAEIGAGDGRIFLTGEPARGETHTTIMARHSLPQIEATVTAEPGEEHNAYAMHSFGAQFAEVRVDPDLGEVRVSRMVSAFAAGRIMNEKTGRSQYFGGMVWGIGMALTEHTRVDDRLGRIMTANLAEYLVPVNADVPALEAIIVPEDDPHVNPIGAKGIGEIGIVGAAAAIANAVYHATGKRIRDLPITPDKLLA